MTTVLPEPASTKDAWNELADQSLLTHVQGQIECGRSTHAGLVGACVWCGGAV